ncbi:MAG: hypothetical protein WCQ90_01155 [Deltaproteobacteria bacterium]
MKKIVLLMFVFLLISACALIPRKTVQIAWPDNIQYIEALCELDMAWKNTKYSGSMSLKLEYPDKLVVDVYGPFGDTVIHLEKDGEKYLLATKEGSTSEEAEFEQDFGIKLSEFIDDLALKEYRNGVDGNKYIQKGRYKIKYDIDGSGDNSICWEMKDGNMCVIFLEAKFER